MSASEADYHPSSGIFHQSSSICDYVCVCD